MTGTHQHDHAAHGDGDSDDGMHGGDGAHTHNNDSNHDHPDQHPHSSHGNGRGVSNRVSNSVDNSSWDASRAMSAAATSEDPGASYKAICAGKRDGDADNQGTWALPHHYKPGGPANVHGVEAALRRFSSTKGLINSDAARSHLEAHMREINPEWKPDSNLYSPFGLTDEELSNFAKSIKL